MHAFRCKNCGFLHTSDDAGEADHPHACRVCGSGVNFDPKTGVKALDPNNWEVLADADDTRLAELGLTREGIKKHVAAQLPFDTPNRPPQMLTAEASEGAGIKDVPS